MHAAMFPIGGAIISLTASLILTAVIFFVDVNAHVKGVGNVMD
jgi:hypothetical protein